MGDGSAAEDDGARRLDGERLAEEPLALTQNDLVDDDAILVAQDGLEPRSGDLCSASYKQVSASERSCSSRVSATGSPVAIVVPGGGPLVTVSMWRQLLRGFDHPTLPA
jgi:hypothetical protein